MNSRILTPSSVLLPALVQGCKKDGGRILIVGSDENLAEKLAKAASDMKTEVISEDAFLSTQMEDTSYDMVVFPASLHRISSLAERDAYTVKPIHKALEKARTLLTPERVLIIQDGIKAEVTHHTSLASFRFLDQKDNGYAERFSQEFNGKPVIHISEGGTIKGRRDIIKELLFTYILGEEKWDRAVREQYGILTKKDWLNTVKNAGFEIGAKMYFADSFADSLQTKTDMLSWTKAMFDESTIVLAAKKNNN